MSANFSCSSIIKHFFEVQEKKEELAALCSSPPKNVKLRSFTLWSCSEGNEMYKKAYTSKVVVLPIVTVLFAVAVTFVVALQALISANSMSLLAALYCATKLV